MNKHTPGPWISEGGEIRCTDGVLTVLRWSPTAEADARLMAAAPDLLEALEEAIIQIDYLHGKFKETGSGNSVVFKALAAINRARGRGVA